MSVSRAAIQDAVMAISRMEDVRMDPEALVEDVIALSYALPDEQQYLAAVANTCKALGFLVDGRVQSSSLKYEHEGWFSYHYQHVVAQGARADMRIMYRIENGKVIVRGFGHRDIPEDFYVRMAALRMS